MKIKPIQCLVSFVLGVALALYIFNRIEPAPTQQSAIKQPVPPAIPMDQIPKALGGTKPAPAKSEGQITISLAPEKLEIRKEMLQQYLNLLAVHLTDLTQIELMEIGRKFGPIFTKLEGVEQEHRSSEYSAYRRIALIDYVETVNHELTPEEIVYLSNAHKKGRNPLGLVLGAAFIKAMPETSRRGIRDLIPGEMEIDYINAFVSTKEEQRAVVMALQAELEKKNALPLKGDAWKGDTWWNSYEF